MALTANGIGSGLDINGLVSQLMTVERQPLVGLATKEATFQAKLSAFGQLKSALSTLQTAADALSEAEKFSSTKATVASDAGFTATSTTGATTSTYAIQVTNLASVQRSATNKDATFAPSAGTLSVVIGGQTNNLDFAGGTIEDLRDAINGADLGISANVVNNGTAKQLVLSSTESGAVNAFTVSGLGIESSIYQVQPAEDATLTIDGIAIRRSSNTITDAIDGVTLSLTNETAAAANLAVAPDKSGARAAINTFVKAYNDLNKVIKDLTAFNTETRQASTLTGDSTTRSIQGQLRGLIGGALTGLGVTSRLSDIGISFKADGTLAVDSTKLDAALNDPARGLAPFFAGTDSVQGFAKAISDTLDGFLSSNGLIAGRTDGINASVKAIGKQREAITLRLELVEKRYRAQFTALDSMIASMTQTSSYLTQQLASLPKVGE